MTSTANPNKTPNTPAPSELELWTRSRVLQFFGGERTLHISTFYRGVGTIYPKPIKVSGNSVRWLRSECEAALQRMLAARDELPKKPERRGRPRKRLTAQQQQESETA